MAWRAAAEGEASETIETGERSEPKPGCPRWNPMTPELVMDLGRDAMLLVLLTSGPVLLASLLTGLVVSIFQAVTQIHEMTLTFVPKIVASFIVLVIFAPWILRLLTHFTANLLMNLPMYAR